MKKLLLTTVMMIAVTGSAYAMPGHGMPGTGGPGGHLGEGLMRALIKLDLTDAQKHEAALILSKYREQGKERRTAFRKAMEGLRETSMAEPLDEEAVRAAYKEVATAGEEMAVHGAKLAAELRGILTPEQKASLDAFKAARHERHGGRMAHKGATFLDEWIELHSKEPQ